MIGLISGVMIGLRHECIPKIINEKYNIVGELYEKDV
jgi:hypothetical protein